MDPLHKTPFLSPVSHAPVGTPRAVPQRETASAADEFTASGGPAASTTLQPALSSSAPSAAASASAAPQPPVAAPTPWQPLQTHDGVQVRFAAPNGPLAMFDSAPQQRVFGKRTAPPGESPAQARPTVADMYHDVGMYRGKSEAEALDDTMRILTTGAIGGSSSKGAQVSVNAGPTNWFASAVSLRIKREPHETGVLMPDDNCPRGANWYGTFSRRVQIPVDTRDVEVLVNGDSHEEIAARAGQLEQRLAQAGLGHVPVVPIDRFLSTRFKEIAQHLPADHRDEFISRMEASPLWTRKAVGEMAATVGDAEFARWRQDDVPRIYADAQKEIEGWFERRDAARGKEIGEQFYHDADNILSEGEQLELARRIQRPYTYAVASAIDGYENYGNGIHNALPPRTADNPG